MYYISDTNVWTAVTQRKISCNELSGKAGIRVLVAPFMIIELMKSTAKSGEKYFVADQKMFQWVGSLYNGSRNPELEAT